MCRCGRVSGNVPPRDARLLRDFKGSTTSNRRALGLISRQRQRQQRRICFPRNCAVEGSSDGIQTSEGWVAARRQRKDWTVGPRLDLSHEAAVQMQLQALRDNNRPWVDHGVEVLYRFAAFDPFERSHYFGRSWDLGQFERFRRLARDKPYDVLLQHVEHRVTSSLQVSDTQWTQRVWVLGFAAKQSAVFDFHMVRRCGGRHDGYWFTDRLLCDGVQAIDTGTLPGK